MSDLHSRLKPDLTIAQRFLDALEPRGRFTFQTFQDCKGSKNPALSRVLHGELDEHAAELERLQRLGAGVFVMVNKGDGKGRSASNVTRVRAHFVDLDGAPIEPVTSCELRPHIVVESSPHRWHAYWRVDSCPVDEFSLRQRALASRFGGDLVVSDLPRVMRLPGFWHLKGEPFMTNLVHPSN